ncbi:hypothetical protein FLGSB24_17140 [Flavobacterium sp. GSB-24]|nr:hypothetical protein FLGSB24_17140 [Flavobacterium sp. GSB-24]
MEASAADHLVVVLAAEAEVSAVDLAVEVSLAVVLAVAGKLTLFQVFLVSPEVSGSSLGFKVKKSYFYNLQFNIDVIT